MLSVFTAKFKALQAQAELQRAQTQALLAETNIRIEQAKAQASFIKTLNEAGNVDPIRERTDRWASWGEHGVRVQQSRQLYETDPLASTVVNKIVENEVGENGPEFEATTGDPGLNDQVETLWYDWMDNAEISGLSWGELCELSKRHYLTDGDVATLLLNNEDAIQLVTADQIKAGAKGVTLGKEMGDGVIVDGVGRTVGYGIQTGAEVQEYPANSVVFLARRKALRDSLGRRIYRGSGIFSANYELFSKACKWRNAEVNAAIAAAKIVFVMTRLNPQQFLGQQQQGDQGTKTINFQKDMGIVLEPGEDIKSFQGSHPTNNFSEPFRLLIRELGAETGLPLELLLCDFSQGNFSSTRAALIFTQRAFKQRQEAFANRYLNRIAKWRISRWITQGKLPDDPRVYNVKFIFPAWPVIDPLKEAQWEMLMRDFGYRTHSAWCLEHGIDPKQQREAIQTERTDFKDRGIPLYHSNNAIPFDTLLSSAGEIPAENTTPENPEEIL